MGQSEPSTSWLMTQNWERVPHTCDYPEELQQAEEMG